MARLDRTCGQCTHDDFDVYLCPLHAAAPVLLEALEDLLTIVRLPNHRYIVAARAAIAQAKGDK